VKLWEAASGTEVAKLDGGLKQYLGLAFTPDGQTLIAAGGNPFITMKDGAVVLFDVATRQVRATLAEPTYQVQCLALSPDGKNVAWASGDAEAPGLPGELKLFELR
jgi:WD40 repeat protein